MTLVPGYIIICSEIDFFRIMKQPDKRDWCGKRLLWQSRAVKRLVYVAQNSRISISVSVAL